MRRYDCSWRNNFLSERHREREREFGICEKVCRFIESVMLMGGSLLTSTAPLHWEGRRTCGVYWDPDGRWTTHSQCQSQATPEISLAPLWPPQTLLVGHQVHHHKNQIPVSQWWQLKSFVDLEPHWPRVSFLFLTIIVVVGLMRCDLTFCQRGKRALG